jgi:branched-chain amino acid transport system ATP-binding protein
MTAVVEARGVEINFGGLRALQGVSFSAYSGQIFAIIGPNGAGKTTLFNVISGIYTATSGTIRLNGEDVGGLKPFELARRGLSRTFQNLQVFSRMSVVENVMVGLHASERTTWFSDLLGLPSVARQNTESRAVALDLLRRVGLVSGANDRAANLAYGELKRLEIARALGTRSRVLLLDEPAAGCNATETLELMTLIRSIAADGVAIILVEHDMALVMNISDRVLVLDQGRPLCEGTPAEIRTDARVIAAYLGRHGAEEAKRHASS